MLFFWPLKARRDVQETAEDLSKRWRENRGIEIRRTEMCEALGCPW